MATHNAANELTHVVWIIQPANSEAVPNFCHLHAVPWFSRSPFLHYEFTCWEVEQCKKPINY